MLDAINVDRTYQRGTFARHAGGMVRAFRATDPLGDEPNIEKAGWHYMVEGLRDIKISSTERSIGVQFITSSGRVVSHELKMDTMLFRGTWTQTRYEKGDVVTYNGSLWHAEEPTDEIPRLSKTWKLIVKHGRDGKDGKDGAPGERGPEGKPGKDLRHYQ